MPSYTIKNNATGELTDVFCSYDEMKEMVNSDPNLSNVLGAPKIVGGLSKDGGSLPDGFKDKLKEIKKKHPNSTGVDHLL